MTPTDQQINGQEPRHVRVGILGAGFGGLGHRDPPQAATATTTSSIFERDAERRRHVVGQHLPRVPVRHPVAPLLVLLRAQPGLDAHLPQQPEIRDYLRRTAEKFGVLRPHPVRPRGDGRELGRRRKPLEDRDHAGRRTPPTCWSPRPAPERAGDSGPARARALRGHRSFHTAAWNHDHDLTRPPRRGRRHRRVGHPGRPGDPAQVAEHLDVFQRTPPWVVPHRDRPITRVERLLTDASRRCSVRSRAGVYWSRELLVPGLVLRPRSSSCWRRSRASTSPTRSRIPRCARSSRRTTRSAASGSCRRTSGTRRWRARTSRS